MKLRTTSPLEGARWVRFGLTRLLRRPLPHLAMFGFMAFGLGLVLSLPWIGPPLALTLLPALCAGWVHATERDLAGEMPHPLMLLAPLRSPRRGALLQLGLLYALAALLLLELADLIDPEFFEQWSLAFGRQSAGDDISAQALVSVQQGMLLRVVLLLPLVLLLWHAPVIIHRTSATVAKAIFASALATTRNLATFVVYGLSWLAADVLLSALVGVLLSLLGASALAMLVVIPISMLFSGAFFTSLHASVHGCLEFDSQESA